MQRRKPLCTDLIWVLLWALVIVMTLMGMR